MWRAWIILSTLVFSVLFRLFDKHGKIELNGGKDWAPVSFPFSDKSLNLESHVYYSMEHIIAILIAFLLLFKDSTPRWIFWLYFGIQAADFVHYWLFYRDEGIGFNLLKVTIFGAPLFYLEISRLWTRYAQ